MLKLWSDAMTSALIVKYSLCIVLSVLENVKHFNAYIVLKQGLTRISVGNNG